MGLQCGIWRKLQVDELEQGTQMPPKSTERFKVVEPLKEVAKNRNLWK